MILSDLIKVAYRRNAVITAYVYGEFGFGKTSYALWTAYEVLGSWNKVLKYLFFEPSEAIKVMEEAIRKNRRIPLIIMDDAGLWLDKLTWWKEDKVAFMEFFNLIRSVTAGVIFTSPSEELPKMILKKTFFRIAVRPISKKELIEKIGEEGYSALIKFVSKYNLAKEFCIATGYRLRTLPSFLTFVQKEFYDIYPLWYPIHEVYEKKRRKALKKYFEEWKSKVKNMGKTREELYLLAKELVEAGKSKSEVAKELIKLGVPTSTVYRWLSKIKKEKE